MRRFKFIEHTADTGFIAYGRTISELFCNAFAAFVETIIDPADIKTELNKRVKIASRDLALLLREFLQKMIVFIDSEGFIPLDIRSIDITEDALDATVNGVIFDESEHHIKTFVKGVTYHGLEIKRAGGIFTAKVILDL